MIAATVRTKKKKKVRFIYALYLQYETRLFVALMHPVLSFLLSSLYCLSVTKQHIQKRSRIKGHFDFFVAYSNFYTLN